jgi:Xaa-Pro dipeptidase
VFARRMTQLRAALARADIEVALITDDDSVYYYTGYYDYLHMEFGRPTILVVPNNDESLLITPAMELDMATAAAIVDRIAPWNDGMGHEWREALPAAVNTRGQIAIEPNQMPPLVKAYLSTLVDESQLSDITSIVANMRMIKSDEELQLARHAGDVANTMMSAARQTIGEDVAEFEVALETAAAGTRKAAELLDKHYQDSRMSPNTHFLQIMASGDNITMPHHRSSTRVMKRGEAVFMCFCGMTNFHRFKLGFDRTFWIGEVADKSQEYIYQLAVDSQAAALKLLRPGVVAEEIHAAYADVIQSAGHEYPFRCGRATGFSFLESPQLVFGDKTVIQPGMVLAVDGSVSVTGSFRAQVGDSFIVTDNGYEQITSHPKSLQDVII